MSCPPSPLPQPISWNPFSGEPKPNQHPIEVPMTPRKIIEKEIFNKEADLNQAYLIYNQFCINFKGNNPLLSDEELKTSFISNKEVLQFIKNITTITNELDLLEKERIVITSRPFPTF